MKICIVSSCGGHLTEVQSLGSVYKAYEHFYVVNHPILLRDDMKDNTYFIRHSERDLLFLFNLIEAYKILKAEKPDLIISTGAGPVVPFALIGKYMFGVKIIFIETLTRISKPSLTGRIMYYLSDIFYVQWPELKKYFPKAKYCGTVL